MPAENKNDNVRYQLVDWSAAWWAGMWSGLIFLVIVGVIVPWFVGGNFWVMIRLISSIVLGPAVLAPPATFDFWIVFVGLLVHFVLSIGFTLVLALVTHRWGLMTGIILGGLFGWGLYQINTCTFTMIFPWFAIMKHPVFLMPHVVFGMLAGGIYEVLEVEHFKTKRR